LRNKGFSVSFVWVRGFGSYGIGLKLRAVRLVLGCDSVLVLQKEIYGKPASPEVAIARWQKMRGQVGELYTGHGLLDCPSGRSLVRTQMTRVQFAWVSDRQIAAYVASGEPLGCAGFLPWEAVGVSRFEPPTFKHGVDSTTRQ